MPASPPDPVRGRLGGIRVRWWITAAVILLAAAGTGIGLAVSGGGSRSSPTSAASRFDQVYGTYHARVGTQSAAPSSALGVSEGKSSQSGMAGSWWIRPYLPRIG